MSIFVSTQRRRTPGHQGRSVLFMSATASATTMQTVAGFSFSVAKSVVSMLIGAAIRDGLYRQCRREGYRLPAAFEKFSPTTNRRSRISCKWRQGVEWNEDYADPKSDVATCIVGDDSIFTSISQKQAHGRQHPGEVYSTTTRRRPISRGRLLRDRRSATTCPPISAKKSGSRSAWRLMPSGT